MRRLFGCFAIVLMLALPGCAQKTNTDGTPTTQVQQVAGTGYLAYIAADAAYLVYLRPPSKPSLAVIDAIEPKRKAARAALDNSAKPGASVADQTAATEAISAYTAALVANRIPLTN